MQVPFILFGQIQHHIDDPLPALNDRLLFLKWDLPELKYLSVTSNSEPYVRDYAKYLTTFDGAYVCA